LHNRTRFKRAATYSLTGDNGEQRVKMRLVGQQLANRKRIGRTCPKPLLQRINRSFPSFVKNQNIKAALSSIAVLTCGYLL